MAKKNHTPGHSYKNARKMLLQNVHLKQDNDGFFVLDVYCKIKYRRKVSPTTMPDHTRLNIEHTWPRSRFGTKRGSRKFRIQEADMHHLYPSDSETNNTRANNLFTQFSGEYAGLKNCPSSKSAYINELSSDAFEPPENHKGNVARALFYFAVRYDMRISAHEEFFLRQWNIIDPVDAEEVRRTEEIGKLQGNRNPFVIDPDLADLITDF